MPIPRIVSVQVLRFLAASLVVWAHSVDVATRFGGGPPGLVPTRFLDAGAVGVDIFFVISGFIITVGLADAERRPSAPNFLLKRWLRVAPLYFLMMAPWVVVRLTLEGFEPGRAAAGFLFWPATARPLTVPYVDLGWTLCFEMAFYAATAVALACRKWALAPWLPLAAFAAAFVAGRFSDSPVFLFWGNPIILEFVFGAAVAAVWSRGLKSNLAVGAGALALSALLFAHSFLVDPSAISEEAGVLSGDTSLLRALTWGAPSALLLLGVLQLESRLPRNRALRLGVFMGDASYALYVSHPLSLLTLMVVAGAVLAPDAIMLVGFALALGVAAVLHQRLERPLQAALGRMAARLQSGPRALAGAPG